MLGPFAYSHAIIPPMAQLLYGRPVAEQLYNQLKQDREQLNQVPGLAIVQVGHDPASEVYVRRKLAKAEQLGIQATLISLAVTTTMAELATHIEQLNQDVLIHGILIQLPLPQPLQWQEVVDRITPAKDVDGLTSYQQQLLASGQPQFIPATAKAILRLLDYYQIDLHQKSVVVAGRSKLVGWPTAQLLQQQMAQVTVIHRQTADPVSLLKQADIIISATGQPHLLNRGTVKPGAIIIDAGITRTAAGLVGDADYLDLQDVVSAITPVPGGVGPLTIACLMANLIQAVRQANP